MEPHRHSWQSDLHRNGYQCYDCALFVPHRNLIEFLGHEPDFPINVLYRMEQAGKL